MTPARERKLRSAQRAARRSQEAYVAEVVAAHEAGATFGEIARVLGITRQSARGLVVRAKA